MRTAPRSRPDGQTRQIGQPRGEQHRSDKQVRRQLDIQTAKMTPAIMDEILLLDTLSRSLTLQLSFRSSIEMDPPDLVAGLQSAIGDILCLPPYDHATQVQNFHIQVNKERNANNEVWYQAAIAASMDKLDRLREVIEAEASYLPIHVQCKDKETRTFLAGICDHHAKQPRQIIQLLINHGNTITSPQNVQEILEQACRERHDNISIKCVVEKSAPFGFRHTDHITHVGSTLCKFLQVNAARGSYVAVVSGGHKLGDVVDMHHGDGEGSTYRVSIKRHIPTSTQALARPPPPRADPYQGMSRVMVGAAILGLAHEANRQPAPMVPPPDMPRLDLRPDAAPAIAATEALAGLQPVRPTSPKTVPGPPGAALPSAKAPPSAQPARVRPAAQHKGPQPAAQPADVTQPAAQPAVVAQPAAQPAEVTQPAAQPVGETQPAAQPAEVDQPAAQPADVDQPAAQPAEVTQPAAQPADATQPATQPVGETQPAAQPVGETQPAAQPTVRAQLTAPPAEVTHESDPVTLESPPRDFYTESRARKEKEAEQKALASAKAAERKAAAKEAPRPTPKPPTQSGPTMTRDDTDLAPRDLAREGRTLGACIPPIHPDSCAPVTLPAGHQLAGIGATASVPGGAEPDPTTACDPTPPAPDVPAAAVAAPDVPAANVVAPADTAPTPSASTPVAFPTALLDTAPMAQHLPPRLHPTSAGSAPPPATLEATPTALAPTAPSALRAPHKKSSFYAVRGGREGHRIYPTWEECEPNVKHVACQHKKFSKREDAQAFIQHPCPLSTEGSAPGGTTTIWNPTFLLGAEAVATYTSAAGGVGPRSAQGGEGPVPSSILALTPEQVGGCLAGEVGGPGPSGAGGGVHAEVSICPKPTQDAGPHNATPLASLGAPGSQPAASPEAETFYSLTPHSSSGPAESPREEPYWDPTTRAPPKAMRRTRSPPDDDAQRPAYLLEMLQAGFIPPSPRPSPTIAQAPRRTSLTPASAPAGSPPHPPRHGGTARGSSVSSHGRGRGRGSTNRPVAPPLPPPPDSVAASTRSRTPVKGPRNGS